MGPHKPPIPPSGETGRVAETHDHAEILRLHERWLAATDGLRLHHLAEVGAGEQLHLFGLDGRTYRGLATLGKDWERRSTSLGLVRIDGEREVRVEVRGDAGWLSSEAELVLTGLPPGRSVLPLRVTEVFLRDDGHGEPSWRIWHLHYSQARPRDGER